MSAFAPFTMLDAVLPLKVTLTQKFFRETRMLKVWIKKIPCAF